MSDNHQRPSGGGTKHMPGTAGYQADMEAQGQQAMDRALAMPLVRVFCGLLVVCFSSTFAVLLADRVANGDWWGTFGESLFAVFILLPLMIDLGSICFRGRSRTPWYRALMRRWHAPSSSKRR